MKSRRSSVCPKCGSDAIKRAHREGLKERLLSLFSFYPYRCRKCSHRFLRFSTAGESPSKSGGTTRSAKKTRRELLLYGLGILLFLALLSWIVREHNEPSEGN
jgi:hypothetical protein